MASRGTYERRGNLTSRTVREKAGANKPITRREMRAAFEAWKEGKANGDTFVSGTFVFDPRMARKKRDADSDRGKDIWTL